MSVTQNVLIGKTKQSIGNATFTTWKGINVMKSKAISVANPRTQGQVYQRTMLANFVKLYRLNAAAFNAGFRQLAVKMSAYNAASSANLRSGSISNNTTDIVADFISLQLAKGSLYPSATTAVASSGTGELIVNGWGAPEADQLSTDKLYIVVYNVRADLLGVQLGASVRSDDEAVLECPNMPAAGQTIYVYTFFVQPASGKVSNSTVTQVTVGV